MKVFSASGLQLKSFAELLHYRSRMVFHGSVGKYKTVNDEWVLFVVLAKHSKQGTFIVKPKRITQSFLSLECMELNEDFTLKTGEKFHLQADDATIEELRMISRGDTEKVISFGEQNRYPAFEHGVPLWSLPKVINPKNVEKHNAQDAVKMARVALATLIAVVEREETCQAETLRNRITREKSSLTPEEKRSLAHLLLT